MPQTSPMAWSLIIISILIMLVALSKMVDMMIKIKKTESSMSSNLIHSLKWKF